MLLSELRVETRLSAFVRQSLASGGPLFVGAPVRPNMPKSASVYRYHQKFNRAFSLHCLFRFYPTLCIALLFQLCVFKAAQH